MRLELSIEEARFLKEHLAQHIASMDTELIHTDKRGLQRDLARDLEHLRSIARQIDRLIAAGEAAA